MLGGGLKLSAKAAVFKKSKLVDWGAKHADWRRAGPLGPPLEPALTVRQCEPNALA